MDLMSSRALPMAGYLWGGSMKDWLMDMEKWLSGGERDPCGARSCVGMGCWALSIPKNRGVREEMGRKSLVCGGIGKGNNFLAKIPQKAGNLWWK